MVGTGVFLSTNETSVDSGTGTAVAAELIVIPTDLSPITLLVCTAEVVTARAAKGGVAGEPLVTKRALK